MNFITDISLWWLLPWSIICIVLSYILYQKVPWLQESAKKWKYALISLRFLSLFLIGVLLLGLLFEDINYRSEKPLFINLIDNSKSMLNYKDSAIVAKNIENYKKELKIKYGDKFEILDYHIGNEVELGDKLTFKAKQSALNKGFEKIRGDFYNRNIGGIAFISDGNYNDGISPLYTAEQIALTPIFTVGVGDTVPKRDQVLKNVVANEISFYRDQFPVQVDLEALKIGNATAIVTISKNGRTVASQSVNYQNESYDFKQLNFVLDADQIGYQQYTVSVSKLSNEYNYQNNSRTFYIEVIDSRNKILLLAGAPNPDIAAIKSVLDQDENIEVKSELIKDWDKSLKNVDLVIWHEPGIQYSNEYNNILLNGNVPVLYIVGPNTQANRVSELQIGMSIQSRNQFDEVQASVNSGFREFEISQELQNALGNFPPLKTKFGTVNLSGGAKVFLNQQVGGISKKEPLLYFGARKGQKYGVIYGEGIWRWKIAEYSKSKNNNLFNELFQKVNQYLVLKQNTSALRITLPKRFSTDEEIQISGEFYNEALEMINKPDIKFTYTNESGKVYKNQFAKIGNKYALSLGKLNKGVYNWKASASYNGKSYEKSGTFVVQEIDLESLSTRADHGMLKAMANNSQGKFYTLDQYKKLITDIDLRDDITSISYKESSFNDLIDYRWLLFLLVLFLGLEWFLRRWLGAY